MKVFVKENRFDNGTLNASEAPIFVQRFCKKKLEFS